MGVDLCHQVCGNLLHSNNRVNISGLDQSAFTLIS
jgi:hypothetical protein